MLNKDITNLSVEGLVQYRNELMHVILEFVEGTLKMQTEDLEHVLNQIDHISGKLFPDLVVLHDTML